MKFFKENSYDIVRLFVNQVGITIFSLVLYSAASITNTEHTAGIYLAVSIFSTLFLMFLLYSVSWEYGSKDRVRVDSGKLSPCPAKGLKLALFANSLNFLLAFVMLIFSIVHTFKSTYFVDQTIVILNIILKFIEAMYIGIVNSFMNVESVNYHLYFSIGYCIVPFLAVAISAVGYRFGYGNIKLTQFFNDKKPKK